MALKKGSKYGKSFESAKALLGRRGMPFSSGVMPGRRPGNWKGASNIKIIMTIAIPLSNPKRIPPRRFNGPKKHKPAISVKIRPAKLAIQATARSSTKKLRVSRTQPASATAR